MHKWEGLFLMLKKYNNGSYQLQDLTGKVHHTRVNGWRLKAYFQRIEASNNEELQEEEELKAYFEQESDGLGALLPLV